MTDLTKQLDEGLRDLWLELEVDEECEGCNFFIDLPHRKECSAGNWRECPRVAGAVQQVISKWNNGGNHDRQA